MNEPTGTQISAFGSTLGTPLQEILMVDAIQPGSEPSYQAAKAIYVYHPLGARIVDTPIKIAQSKPRKITVENCDAHEVQDAFNDAWEKMSCNYYIRNYEILKRIYGASVMVAAIRGENPSEPIDYTKMTFDNLYINVYDPLNVAGSLVLDQNPNSPNFQKPGDIAVQGQTFHRSRALVGFNEQPIYIQYNNASFGFNGRSVFQRALFPLKSFIQSMITDDMVTRKAGLLVAMLKQAGSIINAVMQGAAAIKRRLLQQGMTDNVLSIGHEDKIETLNMQNTDTAMKTARSNIIRNVATACDMPAIILEQDGFAEGFGEGTEDTKNVIRHVDGVREDMKPSYGFMDRIVQHLAWSPEFTEAMRTKYPEQFGAKTHEQMFVEWCNNFKATWPSLLEEPESELSKHEKVKLEGLISVFDALSAKIDPENTSILIQWIQDNINEYKHLFPKGFDLDIDNIRTWLEDQAERQRDQEDAAAAGPEAGGKTPLTFRNAA